MPELENNENVVQEQSGNNIKAIVKDLFDKGAEKDEIIVALNKMKEEGKISDEEVKAGVDYIEEITNAERQEAESLFGRKFIN